MSPFNLRSILSQLFAIGLVFGLVGSVSVVAQPTVSVRGNVGASFFRSPDSRSEILNSGTSLGVEAGIRVYRGLAVTIGGGYDRFTLNEENTRLFAAAGGDWAFLSGTMGLRYTYLNSSDAHPYLSVGAGMYRLRSTNRREASDQELVSIGGQAQEIKTGLHLALGSVFRLNDTYAVFFEPRYVFYDLEVARQNMVRYFTLRLGIDVQLFSPKSEPAATPPR